MPLTIGAVGLPILGGIAGNILSAGDRRKAMDIAKQAAAQFNGIIPPEVKKLIIEDFQQQGIYTPEIEQAIDAGESEFNQIQEDSGLKQAQLEALDMMRGRAKTGITPEDRAALNQVRGEVQRDIQAKNEQIKQDMQARGLGGSGAELAMALQSSQEGADRGSAEADRLAAMISQNALQAMSQSGNMANQLQAQNLGVQEQRASAADQMKRFKVDTQAGVQQRNVAGLNEAQQRNLAEKQRIADTNITRQQAEQERQEQAKQNYFNNQLNLAQSKANAMAGLGNTYQNQANQTASMFSGIGSGAGAGLGQMALFQAKKKVS